MNSKKLLLAFVFAALCIFQINAMAQIHTTVDYKTKTVNVSGVTESSQNCTIVVTEPGNTSEYAYLDQVLTNSKGKYSFNFAVNDIYGTYNMTVNDGSAALINDDIYFDIFVPEFKATSKTSNKEIKYIEELGQEDLVITLTLDHDSAHSSVKSVDTKLLCAAYDEDMKLIATAQSDEFISKNTESVNTIEKSVEFDNEVILKAKTIKAYLWDNDTMYPYTGVWELDHNSYQKKMKVLAIGNSHCENSTKFIYEFAEQLGVEDIAVGFVYIGGAQLDTLCNMNVLNTNVPYYKRTADGWENDQRRISQAIADEDWDLITIQELSSTEGLAVVDSSKWSKYGFDPYNESDIVNLTDTIKTYCLNPDVEIGWHATFAFTDSENFSAAYPAMKEHMCAAYDEDGDGTGDSDYMFKCIAESVKQKIVPDNRFSKIIWNATAIQNATHVEEITKSAGNNGLHVSDGIHIDNVGSVIAGLAWMKGIGYDIDKLERIKTIVEPSVEASGAPDVTHLTDEQFELMKKCVNAAYENPYEITYIQ